MISINFLTNPPSYFCFISIDYQANRWLSRPQASPLALSAVRVELWPCCTRKVARPNHQAPRHQSPTKCNGTWGRGKIGDEYKQTRELSGDPGMVQQSNDWRTQATLNWARYVWLHIMINSSLNNSTTRVPWRLKRIEYSREHFSYTYEKWV